jgi:MinD-like ATPase involved in chromosome partitioning or flagellar assembly
MTTTVAAPPPLRQRGDDQAAGLRRLFAPPAARLLPVLSAGAGSTEAPWLARLAEAFARAGQQTVLVDAARAQIAASFGLRARFDLMHALDGECTAAQVRLDAAPRLAIVPAARACERAAAAGLGLPALLSPLLAEAVDVLLLLLPPNGARLIASGDVLVPVLPTRPSVATAAASIGEAASRRGTLTFRLLFLGMEKKAADTLGRRMAESIGVRSNTVLRHAAVAPLPRDLAQVVAASSAFALSRIASAQQIGSGEIR